MTQCNGIMEDLGAVMGFEATNRLIAIFGGASLYVPYEIDAEHPIARVVGFKAAARLAADFGGDVLNLPHNAEFLQLRRLRNAARLLAEGLAHEDVAKLVGVTSRQVHNYRQRAETLGLLRPLKTAEKT